MADGRQAVVVGMRGAGLREKAARTFEVVAVALDAGFLEPVGHALVFDDAERDVRTRFASGFQLAHPRANLIEQRAFVEAFPGGDQADGRHAVSVRFIGGFGHGFRIHEAVSGRAGLVMRRLRAKAAIFRARAGLGVDNGAKVDFVAFEFLAQAVRPREQIENVGAVFEIKEPQRLVARDAPAAQNPLSQIRDAHVIICVKHLCRHG